MATIRWCPIYPKWDSYQPLLEVLSSWFQLPEGGTNFQAPNPTTEGKKWPPWCLWISNLWVPVSKTWTTPIYCWACSIVNLYEFVYSMNSPWWFWGCTSKYPYFGSYALACLPATSAWRKCSMILMISAVLSNNWPAIKMLYPPATLQLPSSNQTCGMIESHTLKLLVISPYHPPVRSPWNKHVGG